MESRSSRENPKRDWYIWRNAKPNGAPPNNWGSVFGGPAWTWDDATSQYYFHHFLKEQPELNWRNPEVKQAMLEVLHFWLQRGVDGFRIDVVALLIKDLEMRDNPPNPAANPMLHPEDLFGRPHHFYNEDQDEVQEIIREFRRLLDQYEERGAIGELFYSLKRWVRYYGVSGEGLHLPFNFRLIDRPWQVGAVRTSVDKLEAVCLVLRGPITCWETMTNRDCPPASTQQARVAAMLLLTLRGTPTLYYGDELGMMNGTIPPEKIQDLQGLRLGAARARDVARTPMQWSPESNAGFSRGGTEPWLPLSADNESVNVEFQA